MGFKILLVLAVSVYLVNAAATKKEVSIDGGVGPVPWYDCSERETGNYNHPSDCSKYMACTEAHLAYEMPCAPCNYDPVRCPDLVLHYHQATDQCLFVDEAGCTGGGGEDPKTTPRDDDGEGTTAAPSNPPRCPTPGDACDPDDCEICGYCHDYVWCKREDSDHRGKGKKGTVTAGRCNPDHNLYFNRNRESSDIHGGVCDFWSNLDPDTKLEYNNNRECISPHCEWKEDPDNAECSPTYLYFNPDKIDNEENQVKITCPSTDNHEQLYWNQTMTNCLHCSEVFRENGDNCC